MPPELDEYAQKKNISYWSCTVSFYGPPKANEANWEFAKEKFLAIPNAKFFNGESYKLPLTPEQRQKVHKPVFGIPSLENFSIGARSEINPSPKNGHMWFAPIIPRTSGSVEVVWSADPTSTFTFLRSLTSAGGSSKAAFISHGQRPPQTPAASF